LSGVIGWSFTSNVGANLYYVLMAVFLPYFVVFRIPQAGRLAARPAFWLWVLTAFVPVALVVLGSPDPWAAETMKMRIIAFSVVAGTALVLEAPDAKRMLRVSALIVLTFAIPLFFVELIGGSIFSVTEGRAAGLYGNANDAGAAILVSLLFVIDLRRPTTRGLLLAAAATAAVFATFSRSAILFAVAVFAAYALAPQAGAHIRRQQRALVLGLVAVVGVATVVWLSQNIDLSDEAAMRLQSLLTANVSDASSQGRVLKAEYAMDVARENFWGHGPGFVEQRDIEPHNTYLYLAVDYGVPGVVLYLTILFAALRASLRAGLRRGANAIAITLLLIWSSFFTHYVAGASFFAVAFASLISGSLLEPSPSAAASAGASAEESVGSPAVP
jgi:O-antigen ligase